MIYETTLSEATEEALLIAKCFLSSTFNKTLVTSNSASNTSKWLSGEKERPLDSNEISEAVKVVVERLTTLHKLVW